MTHTPTYGNLISLGIRYAVERLNVSPEQIAAATRYRDLIASTGRFLTFCRGHRHHRLSHATGPERARRTPPRARDRRRPGGQRQDRHVHQPRLRGGRVHRQLLRSRPYGDHFATFIVPVNAPGVTVICRRKIAARHSNPFIAPHVEPLRRAGRADMAGRGAGAVGSRLPAGGVARADGPVAVLAPALLLAGEGRVHPGTGAGVRPRDGPDGARARRSSTWWT